MITALACKIDAIDGNKLDKFVVMQQDSATLIYRLKTRNKRNQPLFLKDVLNCAESVLGYNFMFNFIARCNN